MQAKGQCDGTRRQSVAQIPRPAQVDKINRDRVEHRTGGGCAIGVCYGVPGARVRSGPRGARMGGLEMSVKHFGAAVAVAGLLTGFPISPVELARGIYGIKETSDYGGADPFAAASSVAVANSKEIEKVSGAAVPNTRSSLPANERVNESYANILSIVTSDNYSIPPVIDPLLLQTTFNKGNSNAVRTLPHESARQPDPTPPPRPSRAVTSRSHPTLPLAGCVRCVRGAARASAGRANLLIALLSKNFSHKSGSVLRRHPVASVGRQRDVPLLTASAVLDAFHAARTE